MAKKQEPAAKNTKASPEPAVKTTKARNTEVPPAAKAAPKAATAKPSPVKASAPKPIATTTDGAATSPRVTHEMIAERAYHLWLANTPGNHDAHWAQAERELRGS